jgi:hypothetical protein
MAEIATWSAILNKTGLGKTSNECPTKAELLALNNGKDSNVDKVIVISNAASYGSNECVKLEDINAEQWVYTFRWTSQDVNTLKINHTALGEDLSEGFESYRKKAINGSEISDQYPMDISSVSGEPSWASIRVDYETYTILSQADENRSESQRSRTVTLIQAVSGRKLYLSITQAAGRKVYSSWSYNCRIDKTSFSYSGGQSNVTAKSASRTYTWNGQGSSYTESETATVRVSSPASISGNSITIPSNSDSARTFTVTFDFSTATDQTLTISQEGGVVSYVDHLSISPTSKTVSGSGQTFSVTVDANFDKYINGVYQENISSQYSRATVVSGNSSDISISRTSYGCDITVDPNPSESSSRTYVVEFEYDSATPVRLNITQYSAEVSYPSGGYYLGQSRVSNSGFTTSNLQVTNGDNKGGSFTVYYKSYRTKYVNGSSAGIEPVTPNVSPKDLWVNTYIDPRPNSDNVYTVEVRYQANLNHSNRSTRITGSNGSAYDVYVDFTQDPADSYEFQIRKTTSDSWSTSITYDNWPGNDGVMDGPFIINSLKNGERFTNWWASSNVDWITIQDDGSTVRYTVATNNGSSSRTGVITFTQGESGKTCTLTVIQNAGISYRFSFNEPGDQTESALSGDFSLQTKYIQVYSNNSQGKPVQFSLSGIVPSWVSLNIRTTNTIPEEVRVEFDENPTHANRSGTITLIQSKSGKTLTLKVSQAGRFYNLELLGSGVVYLWDDVIKPTDFIAPNTKYATQCPTLLKHQGSLTVNNSSLGSLGVQVGNGDRVNIYSHDGTWRFVTSFTLIQGDQAISW